jgi:DNA-binding CsgD family transcriptional regulator/PAS domain-containing protein
MKSTCFSGIYKRIHGFLKRPAKFVRTENGFQKSITMKQEHSVEEIFFKYLLRYQFREEDLDYAALERHKAALQVLADIGNSGVNLFDINKREIVFYSLNFGRQLGYDRSDYEREGQYFFMHKLHPDDAMKLSLNSVSIYKIFDNFSREDKLNHKMISEYRMLNAQGKYVRLIEQHQFIELDKKGQIWLLLGIADISPNQEEFNGIKTQFINFKTGQIIPWETPPKAEFELTKRELEILRLVKDGLLSKEISNVLSISLHTVNTHRQRFLEKLGANNSMEAVMFASRFGLLD